MKRILGRLTYANVIATLALFIALGGASYAALKLPKNSVGARQLKKGAVTPAKISVAASRQLRGATGPAGPTGPVGPAGVSAPGAALMAYKELDEAEGETPKTVLTLPNLPAGSYAISASLEAFTGGPSKLVGCSLEAGGAPGSGAPPDSVSSIAGDGKSAPVLAMQTVHTFDAAGGRATISCFDALGSPSEHVELISLRITAIQVGSQSSVGQ